MVIFAENMVLPLVLDKMDSFILWAPHQQYEYFSHARVLVHNRLGLDGILASLKLKNGCVG